MGQDFPHKMMPIMVQKPIKLALIYSQAEQVGQVLKEWGSRIWDRSSGDKGGEWATLFSVLTILSLLADKIIVAGHTLSEAMISFQGCDLSQERDEFRWMASLVETELFGRCKEIFHWKFQTRMGGN